MWNYPFTCFLTISLHVTNSPINLPVFSITPCCFYLSLVSNALIFHTTPIQSPHSVPGAELIRGFGEVRVEATDYHTIISCPAPHLFYPVPIHIPPLCKRWEMTSPVLTTIIQKQQQHAGKRRPWGRHENNGNIVPHLNAQHAGAETTSQCVCVYVRLFRLYPEWISSVFFLIMWQTFMTLLYHICQRSETQWKVVSVQAGHKWEKVPSSFLTLFFHIQMMLRRSLYMLAGNKLLSNSHLPW